MNTFAVVSIAVCVGAIALVWIAEALRQTARAEGGAPRALTGQVQGRRGVGPRNAGVLGVAVVCAVLAITTHSHFKDLAVNATWVRLIGLAVLLVSSAFTVWARVALGAMWSVMPKLQGEHHLQVDGPYAVTRHPIYTGGLGIVLGVTLLGGIGQWVMLLPACLIALEVKIRVRTVCWRRHFRMSTRGTAAGCRNSSRGSACRTPAPLRLPRAPDTASPSPPARLSSSGGRHEAV